MSSDRPRLRAVPRDAPHAMSIKRGSAYSTGTGSNTGHRANLGLPWHYPVQAECVICGCIVIRDHMEIEKTDWMHTDRKPGDAAAEGESARDAARDSRSRQPAVSPRAAGHSSGAPRG